MSPKTKEQVAEIRRKSAEQILQAALELFARQGFHNTSISAIAQKAKVSKGLLYNYFEGKDDLLKHIIVHAMDTGTEIMDAHVEDQSPLLRLEGIIDDVFANVTQNPEYWKLIMALSMKEDIMQRYESLVKGQQVKNLDQFITLLTEVGAEDPVQEAMFFAAALDGVLLHFIHLGEQYPVMEMADFLKQKIRSIARTTDP